MNEVNNHLPMRDGEWLDKHSTAIFSDQIFHSFWNHRNTQKRRSPLARFSPPRRRDVCMTYARAARGAWTLRMRAVVSAASKLCVVAIPPRSVSSAPTVTEWGRVLSFVRTWRQIGAKLLRAQLFPRRIFNIARTYILMISFDPSVTKANSLE